MSNRNRQPYAMKVLIEQVRGQREDAEVEVEEPDGFGVYRRVTFDEQTSDWLEPMITAARDERIANHFTSRGGKLIIDFVTTHRADSKAPFALRRLRKSPEQVAEERRKELNSISVAELRSTYGYPENDRTKKTDIVEQILAGTNPSVEPPTETSDKSPDWS